MSSHASTPDAAQAYAVKATVAISYVPEILFQLDNDTREMFAAVMQAQRDGAYEDGFNDSEQQGRKDAR